MKEIEIMRGRYYRVYTKKESEDNPLLLADNVLMQEGCAVLVNYPTFEDENFKVIAVFPISNIKKIMTE